MSRIGKQPIPLNAATVALEADAITVNGPKGSLKVPRFEGVEVRAEEGTATVTSATIEARAMQGLQRTLLQNAVTGVTEGWKRELELNGVGMRAALAGSSLNLSLGFSHPVAVEAPSGIEFSVVKNVITVAGIDKYLVGETAAKIRALRKPEPYKGKGIRFMDEVIRRKAGKTGKTK